MRANRERVYARGKEVRRQVYGRAVMLMAVGQTRVGDGSGDGNDDSGCRIYD
ncbi:hypothetical protein A2U01_0051792, partial [Trifolium medium]|nr:hypothetical protein [Trifolium medium]